MRLSFARLATLLLAATLVGCRHAPAGPELGDTYPLTESSGRLMVAPSQTWPHERAVVGGISYSIAVDDSSRIAYISSDDPGFTTPEGLSTASTLEDVLAAGGSPVVYERGWAHFSELPSGWCAAFYGPEPDIFAAPTPGSRVAHFFRR